MREIIIILTVLISNHLLAQNISTIKNGTDIESITIEVLSFEIKYKEYDNLLVPDSILLKGEVSTFKYENGKEYLFYGLNPREDNRFGINTTFGGPTILVSLSLDYFITPSINLEAGFGFFGIFGGIRYHIFGNRDRINWTPYIGLYSIRALSFDSPNFIFLPNIEVIPGLYIPLGIQYMGNYGFTIGLEIAKITANIENNLPSITGAIKIGAHF